MVSLNDFYTLADAIAKKNLIGGTVTPTERDIFADRAQMQVFEKDRAIFIAKQETSDYLELFLKNTITGVLPTGNLSYPSDFQHTASIRSYYVNSGGNSVEKPVLPVKNADWGEISTSHLQVPTKQFPKYTEFKKEYRFLPKNIGIVMIDYFKTPVVPVWGFTTVNGRPVYNAGTTTNFEWDAFALGEVLAAFLSLVGISIKDGELNAWATQYQQTTNSVL